MRIGKPIIIAFVVVLFGYMLSLFIGMSSTYPAIKKYKFGVSKADFNRRLADRIRSSEGWSFEQGDSIKEEKGEACYWASFAYRKNEQNLEYMLKYCFEDNGLKGNGECAQVEVVSIIDYNRRKSSPELSDHAVERLVHILDRAMLEELAPNCSD